MSGLKNRCFSFLLKCGVWIVCTCQWVTVTYCQVRHALWDQCRMASMLMAWFEECTVHMSKNSVHFLAWIPPEIKTRHKPVAFSSLAEFVVWILLSCSPFCPCKTKESCEWKGKMYNSMEEYCLSTGKPWHRLLWHTRHSLLRLEWPASIWSALQQQKKPVIPSKSSSYSALWGNESNFLQVEYNRRERTPTKQQYFWWEVTNLNLILTHKYCKLNVCFV